jgi:hypothetical protein
MFAVIAGKIIPVTELFYMNIIGTLIKNSPYAKEE